MDDTRSRLNIGFVVSGGSAHLVRNQWKKVEAEDAKHNGGDTHWSYSQTVNRPL